MKEDGTATEILAQVRAEFGDLPEQLAQARDDLNRIEAACLDLSDEAYAESVAVVDELRADVGAADQVIWKMVPGPRYSGPAIEAAIRRLQVTLMDLVNRAREEERRADAVARDFRSYRPEASRLVKSRLDRAENLRDAAGKVAQVAEAALARLEDELPVDDFDDGRPA